MMLLFTIACLFKLTISHSWIECVDYDGPTDVYDKTKCKALPRPLSDGRSVGSTFGLDIGMDHRPGASGNQCQGNIGRGLSANYGGNMVSYKAGQTYTLAWPPKNHVAAACTNPYIPDTSLELFVEPYNGASDPATFTRKVSASFSDDPHEKNKIDFKGFQNCPRFCDNTDKALCTGTFKVPDDLADGHYTFQWRWVFNQGTAPYVTCFDAEITGDCSGDCDTIPAPPPTAPPASSPTPDAACSNPAGIWQQCGGNGWTGPTCCATGLIC